MMCQIGGGIAVIGVPFGADGTAVGRGNVFADFAEFIPGIVGQAIVTELQTADEGAVHQQIGVTADWRREMRIVAQAKTEMADIVGVVFCLTLRAQHQFMDQAGMGLVGNFTKQGVEIGGAEYLCLRQFDTEFSQHFTQFLQFFAIRLVVDAEHRRLAQADQLAGGSDIGGDHEFFDQPVTIQTLDRGDRLNRTDFVENDFSFWQVEFQRAPVLRSRDRHSKAR